MMDKIYGMPFSADASVLIWNKNLFEKAGLDPEKAPTSWDEIRKDAEAVAALGRRDLRFLFFRQLRWLQHLHFHAAGLGFGWQPV